MSNSANSRKQESAVLESSVLEAGVKALPRGKAVTTERDFPHIIEIDLPLTGLDVRLSRAIRIFHQLNNIAPHFGRTRTKKDHHYCRWCFADPALADAFHAQFGGARVTNKVG
jgi:hypothetical protein